MAKLTLCDWDVKGNTEYLINTKDEFDDLVEHWFERKKDGFVFVCFQAWCNVDYEEEYTGIYVTHRKEDAEMYCYSEYDSIFRSDFNFSVFEFETYEEAFKYCIDLKEGL